MRISEDPTGYRIAIDCSPDYRLTISQVSIQRSSSLLWTCSSSDNCLLTVRSSNQKEGPVMTREGLVPKYPKYLEAIELLMGGADL